MSDTTTTQSPLTIYTATWCGPCQRLKARLTEQGVAYDEIDIEADDQDSSWLWATYEDNVIVPTVRFADGTSLVNPPVAEIVERLAALSDA